MNLFGTYRVIQGFLPMLTRSRGAIVNNLSLLALAPLPLVPAYSVSKAAAFSMTQSLRALLAGRGVRVHAVLTGPTDTDMTRGLGIPKASPESVARAIFDAVEHGEARREVLHNHGYAALMAGRWPGGEAKTSLQPAASDMYSPPTFLPFSRSIKADGVVQLSGRKLRTVHDDGKWTSVTGEGHETVDSTDRTLQMSPVISSSWRMSFLSPSRSPR